MRIWPQSIGDAVREDFAFLPAAHGYRLIADSDAGLGGRLTYRSPDLWIAVHWDRSARGLLIASQLNVGVRLPQAVL